MIDSLSLCPVVVAGAMTGSTRIYWGRFYFFCSRPECQRTNRLSRPVFTVGAQQYMLVNYGTVHDKRGNIVWRLYEEEDTWWEPANPVDPVNWLISRAPMQPCPNKLCRFSLLGIGSPSCLILAEMHECLALLVWCCSCIHSSFLVLRGREGILDQGAQGVCASGAWRWRRCGRCS